MKGETKRELFIDSGLGWKVYKSSWWFGKSKEESRNVQTQYKNNVNTGRKRAISATESLVKTRTGRCMVNLEENNHSKT